MIGNNLGTIYIFVPLLKIPIMKATAFIRKSASKNDTNSVVEKPLNFDPFGHARFAHLFVLYD